MNRVLMVGPGENSNGGISKVITIYTECPFWLENNICWIQTHASSNILKKLIILGKAIFKFSMHIRKSKICHLHFTNKTSASRKFIFFLLSKLVGLKTISHIHSADLDQITVKRNFAFKKMLFYSDDVIVLSPSWANVLSNIVERKFQIVNNPCSNICDSLPQKERLILYAGKLEERKGYLDLLSAMLKIGPNTSYHLVIAGDGETDRAIKFVQENNMNNVQIVGWLDSSKLNMLYRKADIFVLPSYGEGFPMSIIEALGNYCAVISTPVGGIPDYLKNRINCLLIESGNIESLSYALRTLIEDDVLKFRIQHNGHSLARDAFSVQKITDQISSIYSKY